MNQKSKTLKTVISTTLVILMVTSMLFAVSSAQTTPTVVNRTIATWLYVGTSAGGGGVADVGVGQNMLVTAWTKDMPPDVGETGHLITAPNGRAGWDSITITIIAPDGTSETKTFPRTDPVGNGYMSYTPTMAGTYTIYAHFPGQWRNSTVDPKTGLPESHESGYPNIWNTYYTEATSRNETFTVVQDPVPMFPESPLPQDYWTRPISGASRQWWILTGNKLGGASGVWPSGAAGGTVANYFYGDSPLSAHILWTKPYTIGGIMDSRFNMSMIGGSAIPSETFETTHYQGVSFTASLIIDGKIYCTPRATNNYNSGLQVIDLYTGETLYMNYTDIAPSFGSIYNYNSPNQMGGFAYIWKSSAVATTILGAGGGTVDILPQVIDVANATINAQCQVTKLGNDYTINRTATKTSVGTVWEMLDASTMVPICWITNITQTENRPGQLNAQGQLATITTGATGTQVYGQDGSITYYNIVNLGSTASPQYYLQIWNTSAGTMVASPDGTGYWQYRPAAGQFGAAGTYWQSATAINNAVHDGRNFFSQNVSLPSIVGPVPSMENGTIQCIREGQYMIVGTQGWTNETGTYKGWMMGIGLAPDNMGKKLWESTYSPPLAQAALNVTKPAQFQGGMGLAGVYPEDGVLVWSDPQYCKHWVYDLYTGQLLWETQPEAQYEYYGISTVVYNHMLLAYGSYGGQIVAYDVKSGTQLWNYTSVNIGFESPYGNYPMSIAAVDGYNNVFYTITSEHHNIQPMFRGPNLRCINASNGQEVWKTLCFGSGVSIADGILVKGNNLDNMIYAFGKGPSATTVTTQDVQALGMPIMVKGTVTDQTNTGRRNTNDHFDWTLQGTPAISDADMSAWMEYKFQQQAKPTNATGVPVTLTAIDPNGNWQSIGTVTSDMNGNYAIPFNPSVPGTYSVFANFAGTNSYGPSSATCYFEVAEPASTATTAPTPVVTASIADTYFLPAIGALFVLFIVVIALLVMMMRKRP